MENSNPTFSAAAASSSPLKEYYDVFLSFRGEDTRNNFTGHLREALRQKGFHTFFDDDKLERGKEINPELLKAIEDSQCSIVILSETYAYSSWCLTELAKIVEGKGISSGRILPIFYHVDPGHVRNQIGSYGEAFKKHERDAKHNSQMVQSWRDALKTVGNLAGWHVTKDTTDESKFIKDFIVHISRILDVATLNKSQVLFGMDSRLEKLKSYIVSPSSDMVQTIGICGMGGIGKTTLAKAYYNQIFHKFDGGSFLGNVRETCEKKENGLVYLQTQLLSNILKVDNVKIDNVDRGIDMIIGRLRHKKVLIVLDDVNELDQLEALADQKDGQFGLGSIIIVTTRDESLLRSNGIATIYEAEILNYNEALQLFSWKAFKNNNPPDDYKELCKQVIEYVNGLPLALVVLGSFLGGKKRNYWENALIRLRKNQKKEIIEVLKISFDNLEKIDQYIFLDIACFFKEYDKDHVIDILNCCDFDSEYGINNLIEKSLLSIQHNKLHMHDLLEAMGKEIVRNESHNEPGRQSRIWDVVDFLHILENEKGTDKVEAIVISLFGSGRLSSFEAISHMKNLRLLMISDPLNYNIFVENDSLTKDLEYLSSELQLLQWDFFPYRGFPSTFRPYRLVQMQLLNSSIENFCYNYTKPLRNLKIIDLSWSQSLVNFENFTVVPNLEKLILKGCIKLLEIHNSITSLEKLTSLDLEFCRSLKKLPKRIKGMNSLKILKLYGCGALRELPEDCDHLKSLKKIDVRSSGISHWPTSNFLINEKFKKVAKSSVEESMINLSIGDCFLLTTLTFALRKLDLSNCNILDGAFPKHFWGLVSLEELDLSENAFSVLPPYIKGLSKLKILNLMYCESLRYVGPELPSSLERIRVDYCTSLNSFLDPLEPCILPRWTCCVDCFELVKRQDGEMMALTSLRRYIQHPQNYDGLISLGIVIPGSEIPAWFTTQSLGPSIKTKLDPNWRDNKLMGLAFSMCFGAFPPEVEFSCEVKIGPIFKRLRFNVSNRSSNHLFLSYFPSVEFFSDLGRTNGCVEIKVSFYDNYDHNYHNYDKMKCGVRVVFGKDKEELDQITSNSCALITRVQRERGKLLNY